MIDPRTRLKSLRVEVPGAKDLHLRVAVLGATDLFKYAAEDLPAWVSVALDVSPEAVF